jgi:hypothetical protein
MATHRRRLGHFVACALAVLAASLTFSTGAANANTKGEHCVNPSGVDLNQRYGVAATIVAPFCAQLRAGEHWTTPAAWFMARAFEQVPAEFVPAGATPLDDLRAKLTAVKYVVDAGTPQERTHEFANGAKLWTGELPFGPPFGDLPAVNTVTLGTLHPLSAGRHTVDRYWRLSAMHCDGLGTDTTPGHNCFPAGETFYGRITFEVLPAAQAK